MEYIYIHIYIFACFLNNFLLLRHTKEKQLSCFAYLELTLQDLKPKEKTQLVLNADLA